MIDPALLEVIIRDLPVVVFCKDYKDAAIGRYVIINRAAEEFFGHAGADMLGKTDYDFFPKHQADFFNHTDLSVLERQQIVEVKLEELVDGNGENHFVRTLKYPIGSRYILGVAIDITEQILSEQAAQHEHNLALGKMKLAAVGELTASLIHEIKNPLSVAMAYMGRIEEAPADADYIKEKTPKILNSLGRINQLIDRFKRYSFEGASSKSNDLQEVKVAKLVQHSIDLVKHRALHHSVSINVLSEAQDELSAVGRPLELEQILINLLSNSIDALIFTKETRPGVIEIDWKACDTFILISVRDNGPGVPVEKRQEIFQPFVTSKKRGEGLGLGLSLSRTLAESMDGELSCLHSEQGAHFTLKIPTPHHSR